MTEKLPMRFFRRAPQWAESCDGVSIRFIDRFHIRYESAERYCDLYREPVFIDGHAAGSAISLESAKQWVMKQGSDEPISLADRQRMKVDLFAAWEVLGSEGYKLFFD